jgi:biopolymer transport protein ExbB
MWLDELVFAFVEFLDKGGLVLWGILFLSFYLFALISQRFIYLLLEARKLEAELIDSLKKNNIFYELVRLEFIAKEKFFKHESLIKVTIAMLPLFGLLGTVSGMIEVFDVMAIFGNSNPRLMASGVSKAIIPTMSGMAIAVLSILTMYIVKTLANKRMNHTLKKLQEIYNASV